MPFTDSCGIDQFEAELRAAVLAARAGATGPGSVQVRCRIPMVLNAPSGAYRFAAKPTEWAERALNAENPDEEMPRQCAVLDRIEGPASSTSQDWYGTRMTKDCLEGMATQFRAGVDYFPRHHSFMTSIEWDDVMGRTVDARVERATIKNAPEGESNGDQFVLYATIDLYSDSPQAEKLVSRIRAGHAPGQSIGGWFTSISVQYSEEGDVIYPIDVLAAELDHLATVRSPANPDADRVWLAVQRAVQNPAPEERSVPSDNHAPADAPRLPVMEDGDILVAINGDALRSTVAQFQFNRSGEGAQAPAPSPSTEGRTQEIDMPMDETALAELIRSTVAGALAPVVADIETLRAAQRSAAPVPVPAPVPAPAPAEDPTIAALRARAERAEAERDRLAAEPIRVASRASVPAPVPAPAEVPEMFRARTGTDLRTVAPIAVRQVVRSGGEIPLTPGLVVRNDGMVGLVGFAKAQGEARATIALAEQFTQLTADPVRWGQNGDHGVLSRSGALRSAAAKNTIDLGTVLAEILWAADSDGLLNSVFSA